MNYLTDIEKKRVLYSDSFMYPQRELTDIEKEISRLITVYNCQGIGDGVDRAVFEVAKADDINKSLAKLNELTASTRLSAKFVEAMTSEKAFDEFTEKYPYAKYWLLMGNQKLTSVEQLAKDVWKEGSIHLLLRWMAQVTDLCNVIPAGLDVFIWTPETRLYNTRAMAKHSGDKAFYGYVLPEATQKTVNQLFQRDYHPGAGYHSLYHVRAYDLHKDRTIWDRVGFSDIADEVFNSGLEISFKEEDIFGDGPRDYFHYHYLELKKESTGTRLRFIVEG